MLPDRYRPTRVLRALGYRANERAKDAVFNLACAYLGKWQVLSRLAPRCGVPTFVVKGSYGEIRGTSADTVILPEYVEKGVWAEDFNRLIKTAFGDGPGTYIDIGANIGLTTIPIAQNPKVRCFAIEPEPATHENLVANIAANCPHGNVTTKRVAVFDKKSTLSFELSPANSGDHRIRMTDARGRQDESNRKTIDVEAAPLDDILADLLGKGRGPGPLVVKIDTQGAEPFVFAGGSKLLSQAELIIVEWSPYLMARMGSDPKIATDFLAAHFPFIATVKFGEEKERPAEDAATSMAKLLALAVSAKDDPYNYCDIIARKKPIA